MASLPIFSGVEFNEEYAGKKFVKLTNFKENHHGFQYVDGLNIDTQRFNPNIECFGGIYFCEEKEICRWLEIPMGPLVYKRQVIIPPDAIVCVEENKFKTNKIILGQRNKISEEIFLQAIENPPFLLPISLRHIPEKIKTEKFYIELVKRNGLYLGMIPKKHRKNENIYMTAIKQNGEAINFISESLRTKPLFLIAIKNNGLALAYIPKKLRTYDICAAAIRNNPHAQIYVPGRNEVSIDD